MHALFRTAMVWRVGLAILLVAVAVSALAGPIAGVSAEDDKGMLNCLCRCLEPKGGQFSCSYDTEDRGHSPSCRNLENGPCICKAFGCFRGALPTEGECYDQCYAKHKATPTPQPAPTSTRTAIPTAAPARQATAVAPSDSAQVQPLPMAVPGTMATDCTTHCQETLKRQATIGRNVRGKGTITSITGEGTHPNCACLIDYANPLGVLARTERLMGDSRRDYIFDEKTGQLLRTDNISLSEERERIRAQYGFRYTEEQIDQLVDRDRVIDWFERQMQNNKTETRMWHPQFWWQHVVALWDSGFSGSDPSFVDTYQHGRCGHMMQWLERNLASQFGLPRGEGTLSITGEKYRNLLNHTALVIRPQGVSNEEWGELVKDLTLRSGGNGLRPSDVRAIENALVIDPYFKKVITVKEFIKGWSVIRIS